MNYFYVVSNSVIKWEYEEHQIAICIVINNKKREETSETSLKKGQNSNQIILDCWFASCWILIVTDVYSLFLNTGYGCESVIQVDLVFVLFFFIKREF